ncbi:hypothetical protein ACHAPC_008432 [Botrytis cinerea]
MSDTRYPTISPAMLKNIMNEFLVLDLDDFNDTVEVIVGKGETEFRPQFASKVLALHSEYFRLKIKNFSYIPHTEKQSLTINLCEQNIIALEAFFAWNTTGKILSSKRLSPVTVDPEAVTITAEKLDKYEVFWDQLLECYFLADFLGAPAFGNATIDALIDAINYEREDREKLEPNFEVSEQLLAVDNSEDNQNDPNIFGDENNDEEDQGDDNEDPWEMHGLRRDPFDENLPRREIRRMLGTLPHQFQRVYSMTKADSPLRKMLVDKIIEQCTAYQSHDEQLFGLLKGGVPVEFHQDLADELVRSFNLAYQVSQGRYPKRMNARDRAGRRCYYHIHRVGEPCPSSES